MAHSPKVRAAAVADIVRGVPWNEVQAKYKVSRGTLSAWLKSAKTELGTELSPTRGLPAREEARRAAFIAEMHGLLGDSIRMLRTWVRKASENEFLDKRPDDALALGTVALDRVDSIVERLGVQVADAEIVE